MPGAEAGLGQFSQRFLQLVAVVAGKGQLGSVLKDDAILAMKPGL